MSIKRENQKQSARQAAAEISEAFIRLTDAYPEVLIESNEHPCCNMEEFWAAVTALMDRTMLNNGWRCLADTAAFIENWRPKNKRDSDIPGPKILDEQPDN